jgi:hypothetical protein
MQPITHILWSKCTFSKWVAERKIWALQDQARTMLIHAQSRWPEAVTANIWPYAVRLANEVLNATPAKAQEPKSSQELFHGVDTRPNLKKFQPFACPAFVLDNRLQTAKKIPKWEFREKISIYLGMSAQHARSVALILNLTTGHVSLHGNG